MKKKGMGKGVFVLILLVIVIYVAKGKLMQYEPVRRFVEKITPGRPATERKEEPPAEVPAEGTKETPSRAAEETRPASEEVETALPTEELDVDVEELLKRDDKVTARKALTQKLLAAKTPDEYGRIKKALDEINAGLFYSRSSPVDAEFYTVQPGDSLYGIAKRFGSTEGLIMWANGKSRPIARLGERLKVPVGTVKLLVDKSDRRLIVLFNNQYIREYPVGVGKEDSTPVGTFTIETKIEKPDWHTPEGEKLPYGHPDNILGSRWMGFKETARHKGYGLHGTTIPERVGKALSAGCICMHDGDVEDLFMAVPRGAEVVVRE